MQPLCKRLEGCFFLIVNSLCISFNLLKKSVAFVYFNANTYIFIIIVICAPLVFLYHSLHTLETCVLDIYLYINAAIDVELEWNMKNSTRNNEIVQIVLFVPRNICIGIDTGAKFCRKYDRTTQKRTKFPFHFGTRENWLIKQSLNKIKANDCHTPPRMFSNHKNIIFNSFFLFFLLISVRNSILLDAK